MKPGRELDLLIAKTLFGLHKDVLLEEHGSEFDTDMGMEMRFSRYYEGPHYSTDISAAWEVVEHFRKDKWDCEIYSPAYIFPTNTSICYFSKDSIKDNRMFFGESKQSVAHAICLAALKAKGIKV